MARKNKFRLWDGCLSPAAFAIFFLGLPLYPWQAKAVEACRHEGARVAVVAANGSGKTKSVNTVMPLWWLYAYPKGRAILTSGSWYQIETQLWPSLREYESLFHELYGWEFGDKEITTPQGGYIRAFSTKEPKRAEGHHEDPLHDVPILMLVDEAKGIPEKIFTDGINRCTPTCRLYTSSPGPSSGTFYECFHQNRADWFKIHVSAFDCPHISPERIAWVQRLYGPDYNNHPIYRSMILGEFTEGWDELVISPTLLEGALLHGVAPRDGTAYTAVDWAAGGDETVLAERRGNQLRLLWHEEEKDTVKAAANVVRICRSRGVNPSYCFGDVCGLGVGIMQAANAMHKWHFREFNGGLPAQDEHYVDTNAEAWYYFRQSLERGEVCFPNGLDEETRKQLTTRMLDFSDRKGRIKIESKKDMKERGLHSPDRADALIMAWWCGRFMDYADVERKPIVRPPSVYERPPVFRRGSAPL